MRSPETQAGPPGIEPRRLKLYGDLLFNNIEGLLAGNFPVIRKTLGDADWRALVQRFFATHRSETPLFTRIGLELIDFLGTPDGHDPRRPWLAELAHYEWAELGLQLSDASLPVHDPQGDLLAGVPLLSPLAWPLAYQWPVPRIGPEFQPDTAPSEPTLVLLQRNLDGKVQFSALSPLLFQLLARIGANTSISGRDTACGIGPRGRPNGYRRLHRRGASAVAAVASTGRARRDPQRRAPGCNVTTRRVRSVPSASLS